MLHGKFCVLAGSVMFLITDYAENFYLYSLNCRMAEYFFCCHICDVLMFPMQNNKRGMPFMGIPLERNVCESNFILRRIL